MTRTIYLCLVFLFIGTVFAFPAEDEIVTEDEDNDKKIIGGRTTTVSRHKEICSMRVTLKKDQFSYSYSQFCGTTIIAERWAITAAHCVDAAFESKVESESKCYANTIKDVDADVSRCVCDVFITCGITNRRDPGQNIDVEKAIVHPLWASNGVGAHDIALLFLKERVKFDSLTQPAKIGPGASIDPSTIGIATIVGWGAVDPVDVTGSQSPTLKENDVVVHPIDRCSRLFGSKIIRGGHICIGTKTDTSCGGDSGGPLFLHHGGQKLLRGATSFGGKICGEVPSVYVDIMHYMPWIQEKIKRHDPENPKLQIVQ